MIKENPGESRQNFGTPWDIVRAIDRDSFDGRGFDLDVCAERWSSKGRAFISKKRNGKRQAWSGNVWDNCPFEEQGEWLALAAWWAKKGVNSANLVLASTSALYFRPLCFAQGTVDLFEGRISFIAPPEGLELKTKTGIRVIAGGEPVEGNDRANALVLLGPRFPPGVVRSRSASSGELLPWADEPVAVAKRLRRSVSA